MKLYLNFISAEKEDKNIQGKKNKQITFLKGDESNIQSGTIKFIKHVFSGKPHLKGKDKQIEQEFIFEEEGFKAKKLSQLGFEISSAPDGVSIYGPEHLMEKVKEGLQSLFTKNYDPSNFYVEITKPYGSYIEQAC